MTWCTEVLSPIEHHCNDYKLVNFGVDFDFRWLKQHGILGSVQNVRNNYQYLVSLVAISVWCQIYFEGDIDDDTEDRIDDPTDIHGPNHDFAAAVFPGFLLLTDYSRPEKNNLISRTILQLDI